MSVSNLLPAMITVKNYPALFALNTDYKVVPLVDILADATSLKERLEEQAHLRADTIIRRLENRESNLNRYPVVVDPATHRQIIEHKYKINGVDVIIRGDEPSILSVINVLKTYPPSGPTFVTQEKWHDLNKPGCVDDLTTPEIGMRSGKDDKHVSLIYPNKDVYTGSGVIVFLNLKTADQIKATGIDHNQIYIPLFRDVNTGKYASLGGRVDRPKDGPNKNTLYINAIKETREESADLLHVSSRGDDDDDESRLYVNIKTTDNNSKYRSYLLHYHTSGRDELDKLEQIYRSNIKYIQSNPVYNDDYRETDDIRFFNLANLTLIINTLKKRGTITDANILDINGRITNIRGRTMRVLAEAFDKTILTKALSADNQKTLKQSATGNITSVTDA